MANSNQQSNVNAKVTGYLEKKGKLRIGSSWKKYWFVLEGRLLLYYRSKDEYETLSPCKGSINLCPPCNVKPALSSVGVFQIECRASTVTLRAENRSEQEKWMQALLAIVVQRHSSPNRLSHFRYSLDDIPATENTDLLSRQNTMPYRLSDSPKKEKDIIERLQNIGAQTYGGSLSAITKLANKDVNAQSSTSLEIKDGLDDHKRSLNGTPTEKHFRLSYKSHSVEGIQSMFIENDQYSTIHEENSMDLILDRKSDKMATIKKQSLMIENDEYGIEKVQLRKVEHLYERVSSDSSTTEQKSSTAEGFHKFKQMTTNLYERISSSSSDSAKAEYSMVDKSKKKDEYAEHMNYDRITDHNKNKIGDDYMATMDDKSKDDHYSDGLLFTPDYIEYAAIDKTKEADSLYEDPDRIKMKKGEPLILYREVEPSLPPRPEKRNESSGDSTTSSPDWNKKKIRFKILSSLIKSEKKSKLEKSETIQEKPDVKKPKRRSTSFLRKVWRKKTKSLDDNDCDYEVVDYEDIDRQIAKDKNDIQMLQELQKILENRKNMLQEKLNSAGHKEQQTSNAFFKLETAQKHNNVQIHEEESTSEERPSLPPRQKSLNLSPYHDVPQNNQPVEANAFEEKIKSIDEILQDLSPEMALESRKNVKQLIEKFDSRESEDEVVLRKKPLSKSQSDTFVPHLKTESAERRDSDELHQLLEELSKVTSAPVMPPGVTTSLVTPVLTDEEWLNLIPIRRRRLSDPDYDVPRPHRSLQLLQRGKTKPDNAIPATRFFGPVLSPSSNERSSIRFSFSSNAEQLSSMSIDPDSLEVQNLPSINKVKDVSVTSYMSHGYSEANSKSPTEKIYSNMKSLENVYLKLQLSNLEMKVKEKKLDENEFAKSEEVFIDSLEPLAEISTAF